MAKAPPTDWDVLSDGTNTPSTDVSTRPPTQHATDDNSDPTIMQAASPQDGTDEAASKPIFHNVSTITLGPFNVIVPAGASITVSRNTATMQNSGTNTALMACARLKALVGDLKASAEERERERLVESENTAEKKDTPKQTVKDVSTHTLTATKPSTSGDLLGWSVGAILELSVAIPLVVMGAAAALAAVITTPFLLAWVEFTVATFWRELLF